MNQTSPARTVLDEVTTWAGITTQPTARGVELKEWDPVRVPPGTRRGYEAGPDGLEIPRHRRAQSRRGSARRRRLPARLVG